MLLPPAIRATLPPLYSQEKVKDPIVHVKFFAPRSDWTWYCTEGSEQDGEFLMFGYVCGFEREWGYFLLSELESVGPAIERDLSFTPTKFSEINL